jgi:FG-GAP-like repeat
MTRTIRATATAALALAAVAAAAPAGAGATFSRRTITLPGSGVGTESGLGLGDFDEDGRTDVAVALPSGDLSILLRDDAGGYAHAAGSPRALGASYGGPLKVADVNRDGHQDLVVLQAGAAGSVVTVLRGDGHGGFGNATTVPVPGNPGSMTLGDVNGDGTPDLVVPTWTPGGPLLAVQLGAGDGTFAAPLAGSAPLDGTDPSAVVLADFDGDGRLDAAVSHAFVRDGIVTVLRGDGAGGFARAAGSPYDIGSGTLALSAGDLDGDGRVDLASPVVPASGDNKSNTIGVLLGDGDGTFRSGPAESFVTPPTLNPATAFAMPLGDLDGDGRLDAALPIGESSGVWPLLGDGTGRFASPVIAPLGARPNLTAAAIGDLDGDGRLDVLAVSVSSPVTLVMLENDAEPAIDVAPALDLGSGQVGAAATGASLTISNPGDHGLRVGSLTIGGADAGDFGVSGCLSRPIPAGRSCDVTVTFAARAAGARTATLTIASDAPGAELRTVALTATGTPAPVDGGGGGDGTGGGGTGGDGGGDGSGGGTGPGGRDGSGNGGTGPSGLRAALKLTVRPARASLAPGRRLRLTATIRNGGRAPATRVRLCPRTSATSLSAGRCVTLGTVAAGRTVRRTVTVRLARSARRGRSYAVTLVATTTGARPVTARVVLKAPASSRRALRR